MRQSARLLVLVLAVATAAVSVASTASAAAPRAKSPSGRAKPTRTAIPEARAPQLAEPVRPQSPVEVVVPPCQETGPPTLGDPLVGEVGITICGPDTGVDAADSAVSYPSVEPQPRAFDLFHPYHHRLDMVRAYLMSVAAFYIYKPVDQEMSDAAFPGWLAERMEAVGLETTFIEDEKTDTQAAVLWNDDVVILTFRGTTPGADMLTDLQKNLRRMPASWGDQVLVHNGFAVSWLEIRARVIEELEERLVGGRRLWITGHSLGGAIATLAAYDLEVVADIAVEGVHTFGQPRVGGQRFYDHFMDSGLFPRFHRWQIEGDPVPAFFLIGTYTECVWYCTVGAYAYRHVGRTHDILTGGGVTIFSYDFETDVDDHVLDWHLGGAEIEHVKYDNALKYRLELYEKTSLLELLPPLPTDATPSGFLP